MNFAKRFRWWLSMWNSPDLDYREDYETLVRLARRCAYDFSHAADFVGRAHPWMPEIAWQARARSWIALFARGNPGKDYRTNLTRDLSAAESAVESLMVLCEEHGVEVPAHIANRYTRMPF